jgi:hypothetical protein
VTSPQVRAIAKVTQEAFHLRRRCKRAPTDKKSKRQIHLVACKTTVRRSVLTASTETAGKSLRTFVNPALALNERSKRFGLRLVLHRVRRIIAGAVGFGPVVMIRFLPAGWSWFRGRDPLCRNCWKAFIEFVLSDDERDKLIGQFVFLDFGKSVE